jgi:hypothetical protein
MIGYKVLGTKQVLAQQTAPKIHLAAVIAYFLNGRIQSGLVM